jgi:hypothetical protein
MSLPCFFAIVYGPSELIVHGNAAAAKQHRGLLRDESKTYSKPVVNFFFFLECILVGTNSGRRIHLPQRLSGNGTREGRARILVIQGITAAKGD